MEVLLELGLGEYVLNLENGIGSTTSSGPPWKGTCFLILFWKEPDHVESFFGIRSAKESTSKTPDPND